MLTFEEEVFAHLKVYTVNVVMGMSEVDAMENFLSALDRKMITIRYHLATMGVPMGPRGVHTQNCCAVHGCKYGHDDCPVQNKENLQSSPCHTCRIEMAYG